MQNDQVSNIIAANIYVNIENQGQNAPIQQALLNPSTGVCDSIGSGNSNAANQALLREMETIAEDLRKKSDPQSLKDLASIAHELTPNNQSIFAPQNNSCNNGWSGSGNYGLGNNGNGQYALSNSNNGNPGCDNDNNGVWGNGGNDANGNLGQFGTPYNHDYGLFGNEYNNNNVYNNNGFNNAGYGNGGYNNGAYGNNGITNCGDATAGLGAHWSGDRSNDVRSLLQRIVNGGNDGKLAEQKMALKLLRDALNGGNSDVRRQLSDLLNMGNGNYGSNGGNGYGNNNYGSNGGYGNGYGNYNNPGGCQNTNSSNNCGPSNNSDNFLNQIYNAVRNACGGDGSNMNSNPLGQLIGNLLGNGSQNNGNYGNYNQNRPVNYGNNGGYGLPGNIGGNAYNGNAYNGNANNNGATDALLRALAQKDQNASNRGPLGIPGGSTVPGWNGVPGNALPPGAIEARNGFEFSSWGDPHITTKLNGKEETADRKEDNPNFNTVYNTNGGQTRVGTIETPEKGGVTFNDQVNIHHSGPDAWHLNSDRQDDNSVRTILSNRNGDALLKENDVIMQGDGSRISVQGGKVTVEQKTTGGGTVVSTISNNGQGLDILEKATGNAVIDGQAVRQATD